MLEVGDPVQLPYVYVSADGLGVSAAPDHSIVLVRGAAMTATPTLVEVRRRLGTCLSEARLLLTPQTPPVKAAQKAQAAKPSGAAWPYPKSPDPPLP